MYERHACFLHLQLHGGIALGTGGRQASVGGGFARGRGGGRQRKLGGRVRWVGRRTDSCVNNKQPSDNAAQKGSATTNCRIHASHAHSVQRYGQRCARHQVSTGRVKLLKRYVPKPKAKAKARHHAVGAAVQVAKQAAQIAAMSHAEGNPYYEGSHIYAAGGNGPGSDHEGAAPVRRRLTGKQSPPAHLATASSASTGDSGVASASTARRRYSTKQAPRS